MRLLKSHFVKNGENYIHILESGEYKEGSPSLLVVCGIWESAERAIPIHNLDRHVVSFSFRGRGLSSTPKYGYDLDDHLSDIEKVVETCELSEYCLLGFSRGAAYSLGWYLRKETSASGLILVDQAPIHRSIPKESLEFWVNMIYQNVPIINHMRVSAFEGLCREAKEYNFSEDLERIKIPVSVFYGTSKNAEIPSNLSKEVREMYASRIKHVSFIEFEKSGHMIPDDESEKYLQEIERFIDSLV